MQQLFQNSNTLRVLTFFLQNPSAEVYLRELSRNLGINASTVMRSLKELEKAGLILRRDEKNASFFKPKESPAFKGIKIAYSISKILDSKIIDLVEKNSRGLSCFLLFGSAARGEDSTASDYDFLLIAPESKVSANDLSEKLGRDVNLKKFSMSEWKTVSKKNRAFYLDVISNSFVLIGSKPVID